MIIFSKFWRKLFCEKSLITLLATIFLHTNTFAVYAADDTDPPELLSVDILQDEVIPGEELRIEIRAKDPSGLTTNGYHRFIEIMNDSTQQTVTGYLNSYGDLLYQNRTIQGDMACGSWSISRIYLRDSLGNSKYYTKSEYVELLDDSFYIPCDRGDRTPPELLSVNILQDVVQAGDLLKVEAVAEDKESGLNTENQYLYLENTYFSRNLQIPLFYNKVTGKLEGEKLVPSDVNIGKWVISSIVLTDRVGNKKSYSKSNYSDILYDTFINKSVFSGIDSKIIPLGSSVNPLEGVNAYSNWEGDMTSKITVTGEVKPNEKGIYLLRYDVIGRSSSDNYFDFRVISVNDSNVVIPIDKETPIYFNENISVPNPFWTPVMGGNKIMIIRDGRELNPWVYNFLTEEGKYQIKYSGNVERYYGTFIVDKTPPNINVQYSNEQVKGLLEIKVETDDYSPVLTKWLLGERVSKEFSELGTEFSRTFSVKQNGKYTIYARDEAGNESTKVIDIGNIIPWDMSLVKRPRLVWAKTFGGQNYDDGMNFEKTSDGGFIISGLTESFGVGDRNVYLVKTDSLGNIQWENNYGGSYLDVGKEAHETTDHGFIVLGSTKSFGNGYNLGAYLLKTESNGDVIWSKIIKKAGYEVTGNSIKQTMDGGYIITGVEQSSIDINLVNLHVKKLDNQGNIIWEKTYTDTGKSSGLFINTTNDGGYIVTGARWETLSSPNDAYLLKLDSNGTKEWEKTFGGSGDEAGYSVQQAHDGGYIVAGQTSSTDGINDIYIFKTDRTGSLQWERTFGGNNVDWARSIKQLSDKSYLISGMNSAGGNGAEKYLINLNEDGEKIWDSTLGTGVGYSAMETDDSYIFLGRTEGLDVYFAKLAKFTGIASPQTSYTLGEGNSQKIIINAMYSNGSKKDITSEVLFRSNNPEIASVTPDGFVRANMVGTTTITAIVGELTVNTVVNIVDQIAPTSPQVNIVNDQDVEISGSAEPGSTIIVMAENTLVGAGTTKSDGEFSVQIPKQNGGTILAITAIDPSGNVSVPTSVTVIDGTPPSVSINIEGGIYQTAQTLNITSSESGTIYYTLDGSTPTTTSTVYSGPITILASKTLMYFAIDAAGNASAIGRQVYTIINDALDVAVDTDALQIGFAEGDTSISITKNVTLASSGTNGSTISWSSNDPATVSSTGKVIRPGSGWGNKDVTLTATITKGTAVQTKEFVLTVKEFPTLTINPFGGTYQGAQTITITSSDQGKIYYTIDGSTPTTMSALYSSPIAINSSNTIKYFFVDDAGNATSIGSQSYIILYDSDVTADKDSLQIGFATGDSATAVTKDISLGVSGENGSMITWTSSNTTIVSTAGIVTRPAAGAGDKVVTLTATIRKGSSIQTKQFVITVKQLVDTVAPTVTISPVGGTYQGAQLVTITSSEPGNIYYTVNGSTPTTFSSIYNGPLTISFTKTLKYFAIDSVGNKSAIGTQTYTILYDDDVTADTSGLEIKYATGDTANSVTKNVTLSLSGGKGSTISWASSNSSIVSPNGTVTRPTAGSGDKAVTLTATISKGGSVQTKQFVINVKQLLDSTPPTLTINLIGGTYQGAQTIVLTASEPSNIYYTLDGSTPTTSSTVYSAPISISASKTLKYFAVDNSGNASTIGTQSYTIRNDAAESTADANALQIGYASGDTENSVTKNVTLAMSGANGSTISWSSSAPSYVSVNGVVTRPATGEGDQTVTLTATIQKGTVIQTKVFVITVKQLPDVTPPTVTVDVVGGSYNGLQTVNLSASEPATIYYTLDGSEPTTSSYVYSGPLEIATTTTLKYFAVDVAGNASTKDTQVYIISLTATGWVEENHPSLNYSGNWTVFESGDYSGGAYRYGGGRQNSVELTFVGVGISWVAATSEKHGLADVYIDGQFVGEVNLYSKELKHQQVVFEAFGLSNGLHTIKIVKKNALGHPDGKDTNINVDAFDVVPFNVEETESIIELEVEGEVEKEEPTTENVENLDSQPEESQVEIIPSDVIDFKDNEKVDEL
jgi:hypothetical protein